MTIVEARQTHMAHNDVKHGDGVPEQAPQGGAATPESGPVDPTEPRGAAGAAGGAAEGTGTAAGEGGTAAGAAGGAGGATEDTGTATPGAGTTTPEAAAAHGEGGTAAGAGTTTPEAAAAHGESEAEREAQLEKRMSYADLQRRHAHPKYVALAVIALLVAIVAPYAWGRWLAMNRTGGLVSFLQSLDPRGIAFVSWSVTAFALMSVAMMFLGRRRWAWTAVFTILLACEQFIAGFCLLKWDFAYSTNVVYGQAAMGANAANVGIIAAMIALCVFVVLFVLVLVVIRKDSPLNVLTQDWAALIMYWAVEAAALAIVLAMFSRVA